MSVFDTDILPHRDTARRLALRLTRCPDEAADLVQDAMVQALRYLPGFTPGTNGRAWLCRLVRTTHIDRTRRQAVERRLFVDEETWPLRWQAAPAPPDRCEALPWALARLSAAVRDAMVAVYAHGATCADVATATGVPVMTVGTRLHRGRAILQRELNRRGVTCST